MGSVSTKMQLVFGNVPSIPSFSAYCGGSEPVVSADSKEEGKNIVSYQVSTSNIVSCQEERSTGTSKLFIRHHLIRVSAMESSPTLHQLDVEGQRKRNGNAGQAGKERSPYCSTHLLENNGVEVVVQQSSEPVLNIGDVSVKCGAFVCLHAGWGRPKLPIFSLSKVKKGAGVFDWWRFRSLLKYIHVPTGEAEGSGAVMIEDGT